MLRPCSAAVLVIIEGTIVGGYTIALRVPQGPVAHIDGRVLSVSRKMAHVADLIKVLYADTQFVKVTRPLSVGLSLTSASLAKCFAKEQVKLSLPLMQ